MKTRRLIVGKCMLAAAASLVGCGDPATTPEGSGSATARANASPTAEVMEIDWRQAETADGTWIVSWRPIGGPIPSLEPFSVEVRLQDSEGEPSPEGVTVLVDATMPHHGHGMNVEPRILRTGEGRFTAEGMLMHMPGRWEFTVDVLNADSGEAEVERAQWTVMLDD